VKGFGNLGGYQLKIAILSTAEVGSWYFATLLQRGHEPMFVEGHPPTSVKQMIQDGVDGILILSEGDDIHEEIASQFARATGYRPSSRAGNLAS